MALRSNNLARRNMGSDDATASDAPIACTLDIGGFKERLAWIAELNRDALRSHQWDERVLHLRYDATYADRVKEMVHREKQCCAFLKFHIRHEGDDVLLSITAPEEARVAAETLFEQLVSRGQSGAAAPARIALACAAACVAPLAVPAVVLAGTGSMLAWLAGAHSWMTVLATLAVAAAWLWVWRHAIRTGFRPAPSTFRILGIATFLLALAMLWPFIEPEIPRTFGA
jgi:hypothetical protein